MKNFMAQWLRKLKTRFFKAPQPEPPRKKLSEIFREMPFSNDKVGESFILSNHQVSAFQKHQSTKAASHDKN